MKQKGSLALYIPEIVLGKQYWSRVRRFERGFMTVPSWMRPDFTGKDIYDRLGDGMSLVGVDDWDFDKLRQLGRVDLLDGWGYLLGGPSADWEFARFIKERGVDPAGRRAVVYHNESEFDMRRYFGKRITTWIPSTFTSADGAGVTPTSKAVRLLVPIFPRVR